MTVKHQYLLFLRLKLKQIRVISQPLEVVDRGSETQHQSVEN